MNHVSHISPRYETLTSHIYHRATVGEILYKFESYRENPIGAAHDKFS